MTPLRFVTKVNHQKAAKTRFFSKLLVASLGTCASAFATILTVRQISQQRQASYRPELVILSVAIDGCINPAIKLGQVSTAEKALLEKTERLVLLPIRNVGLGAAKQINASWSFPIDEMLKVVNHLARYNLNDIYFELENGVLKLRSEHQGGGLYCWRSEINSNIYYIIPVAYEKAFMGVTLPGAPGACIHSFFIFKRKDGNIPEIPSLILLLYYLDIAEQKLSSKYSVQFEIFSVHARGENFKAHLKTRKMRHRRLLAYFPALEGCNTWGKTYGEAVEHAKEALALYLETFDELAGIYWLRKRVPDNLRAAVGKREEKFSLKMLDPVEAKWLYSTALVALEERRGVPPLLAESTVCKSRGICGNYLRLPRLTPPC